ncbi:MAG: hypothetical protein FWE41_02000 [Coriobacteriia bacterium]|nr:hypothetical protein [Coriobacteriia bacterium]MCL2750693.1 hypothetical protein [Coriobacteriia bacterium]
MYTKKKAFVALLVSLCMAATLGLAGCSTNTSGYTQVDEQTLSDFSDRVEGYVNGVIGEEYETLWFSFTVNSLKTDTSFADYKAPSGKELVIANVTITNTFGTPIPFGIFDWFVRGQGSGEIWPLSPMNDSMMPEEFMLDDKETVTYNVVIEFSSDLVDPYFIYTEIDEKQSEFNSFRFVIK